MGIEMIAKLRRFVMSKAGISPITLRATATESLAASQVEPEGTEMSRAGSRFMLCTNASLTGVGQSSVSAQVTTGAQWVIWNADLNNSYVFEHIGAFLSQGSITGANGIIVEVCIFQSPVQTGATATGLTVASTSNGGYSSRAIVKTAVTITTPAAPSWYTIAKCDGNAAYTIFTIGAINYDVKGRIIVPPGQGLGIAVYSIATGSPLFCPVAMWTEVELDLE